MANENKITSSQPVADKKSIQRGYNKNYSVTDEYRNSLPDCQNAASNEIQGANVPILQVGISNFRLPLSKLELSCKFQFLENLGCKIGD